MSNLDATTLAQQAVKLGLLTDEQVQEGWAEVGQKTGDPNPLVRALQRKGFLTPWQTQKLLKGEASGYFLGGYRILYKISSGSFGRVYRGDDPRTGNIVAVKVLRQKWSEDKHSIDLFEREGKVGMTLSHPNLVQILAVSRDPISQQYFIVMEFVEGGNLREILNIRKKLEPIETVRILEDAAAGLAYAASRGISHRDMKLTNILMSSQGKAKLVDFGLAGLEQAQHKDENSQVDRTVDYAGLERATGVPPGDPRSDIYFLGCIAYELLTGLPPLDMSKDSRRGMTKDRYLQVKPLSEMSMVAPPTVIRLIETMMAYYPHERYQTPSQLLQAVRDVRRELEGSQARQRGAGPRSLFIVEKDERLQDAMREKFKGLGYRVFLAADPVRALERFRQQPFDALILDAGTVGEDGLLLFEKVIAEAEKLGAVLGGILILSEDQEDWARRVKRRPTVAVLMRPVTLKQLHKKIGDLLSSPPA